MENAIEHAAAIASAFLAHNSTRAEDVPELIKGIHDALLGLSKPVEAASDKPKPAVDMPWKKTIHRDHLTSLIDGHRYKTLRRHIAKAGYTPDEYRAAFELPRDYPMVAEGYSERRSALAKAIGLGNSRAKSIAQAEEKPAASTKPKRAKKGA